VHSQVIEYQANLLSLRVLDPAATHIMLHKNALEYAISGLKLTPYLKMKPKLSKLFFIHGCCGVAQMSVCTRTTFPLTE